MPAPLDLSDSEIAALLQGRPLHRQPALPSNPKKAESFLRKVVQRVCVSTGTADRTVWDHYGSGYASYVDAWFYHPDGRARLSKDRDEHHAGVFALLSRQMGAYALGQGEKSWLGRGGSGYLPYFGAIDSITHPALVETAAEIATVLDSIGLRRLTRAQLEPYLSTAYRVPTILSDPPYRIFDAIFHWED